MVVFVMWYDDIAKDGGANDYLFSLNNKKIIDTLANNTSINIICEKKKGLFTILQKL